MLMDIKQLVLEGGGTRCAWQAGFILALQEKSSLQPDVIWSVSASSAIACAMASGRLESAVQSFRTCIAGNKKNIYFSHLFKNRPIFPQGVIYREALLKTFDRPAIQALQRGPKVEILLTRTCASLPGYSGVFAGLFVQALKSLISRPPLPGFFAKLGLSKEFISANACQTPAELADLVLASSCTPPVTPLYSFQGRTALDGGLMENIPVSGLATRAGAALVLRTTRGRGMKFEAGTVSVEPSEDLHIASWDYSDLAAVDRVYDLGRRDGAEFWKATRVSAFQLV